MNFIDKYKNDGQSSVAYLTGYVTQLPVISHCLLAREKTFKHEVKVPIKTRVYDLIAY